MGDFRKIGSASDLKAIEDPLFVTEMGMALKSWKIVGLEEIVISDVRDNPPGAGEKLPFLLYDQLIQEG